MIPETIEETAEGGLSLRALFGVLTPLQDGLPEYMRAVLVWTPQHENSMNTNTNAAEAKQPASAGCHPTTCCASSIADAALEFANSRAEFLAAKQSRNSHKCQNAWRDYSGNGESEPPCRFVGNLEIEEMCEPCQARLKAEEIMQAKSKAATKAWRRFKAISSHNADVDAPAHD